jgi:uncharacterized protein YebE (UPF0316 family)
MCSSFLIMNTLETFYLYALRFLFNLIFSVKGYRKVQLRAGALEVITYFVSIQQY